MENILLAGVGGQGVLLTSKLLSEGLARSNYDIKVSEIHGMAQRGGSVSSQVRFGTNVLSPVIEKGSADILVAFEKIEALRWIHYLKTDGICLVNDFEVPSLSVISGEEIYPSNVIKQLGEQRHTITIKAAAIANDIGNQKVMNIVLLGALIHQCGLEDIDWSSVIKDYIKNNLLEINFEALNAGMNI